MTESDLIQRLDAFLNADMTGESCSLTMALALKELRVARLLHRVSARLSLETRDINTLVSIADLLEEAAGDLRVFMFTQAAEDRGVRYFLPDELEGSAMMLRDRALLLQGVPEDCLELFQ